MPAGRTTISRPLLPPGGATRNSREVTPGFLSLPGWAPNGSRVSRTERLHLTPGLSFMADLATALRLEGPRQHKTVLCDLEQGMAHAVPSRKS